MEPSSAKTENSEPEVKNEMKKFQLTTTDWADLAAEVEPEAPQVSEHELKLRDAVEKRDPPFIAAVTELSTQATCEDVYLFFGGEEHIVEINYYNKVGSKPFTVIEFKEKDSLVKALLRNKTELFKKKLRVEAVDPLTCDCIDILNPPRPRFSERRQIRNEPRFNKDSTEQRLMKGEFTLIHRNEMPKLSNDVRSLVAQNKVTNDGRNNQRNDNRPRPQESWIKPVEKMEPPPPVKPAIVKSNPFANAKPVDVKYEKYEEKKVKEAEKEEKTEQKPKPPRRMPDRMPDSHGIFAYSRSSGSHDNGLSGNSEDIAKTMQDTETESVVSTAKSKDGRRRNDRGGRTFNRDNRERDNRPPRKPKNEHNSSTENKDPGQNNEGRHRLQKKNSQESRTASEASTTTSRHTRIKLGGLDSVVKHLPKEARAKAITEEPTEPAPQPQKPEPKEPVPEPTPAPPPPKPQVEAPKETKEPEPPLSKSQKNKKKNKKNKEANTIKDGNKFNALMNFND